MTTKIAPFYPFFEDNDGKSLDDGYIYIGEQSKNPEIAANQLSVYWDKSLTIPADQPIRTINGFASRSGSPGAIYVAETQYSMTIRDKNSKFVRSKLSIDSPDLQLRQDLASTATDDGKKGFHLVNYPPLSGETGVVNYEYYYTNPLRWIPSNLHAGIKAETNTTDLTPYIQNAVDSGHGKLIFRGGEFYLAKTSYYSATSGIGGGYYAIYKDSLTDFTFEFDDAHILIDYDDADSYSAFFFTNGDNLRFINPDVRGTSGVARTAAPTLYSLAGIKLHTCTRVKIFDGRFENTAHGVVAYLCDDVKIKENEVFTEYHIDDGAGTLENERAYSAFLSYSSDNVRIVENTVYGGYKDGMISIFGNSEDNKVIRNKVSGRYKADAYEYTFQQGITVDQGPKNTKVLHNDVDFVYYGIDIKADSYNTRAHFNTVQDFVVGIAHRKGEAPSANHSSNAIIDNNTLLLSSVAVNSVVSPVTTDFYQIGVFALDRYGVQITNNKIIPDILKNTGSSNAYDAGVTVCGIYHNSSNDPTADSYLELTTISGNEFEANKQFGTTTKNLPDDTCAFFFNDSNHVKAHSNSIKGSSNTTFTPVRFKNDTVDLDFSNNKVWNIHSTVQVITLDSGATVTDSKFKGTHGNYTGFFDKGALYGSGNIVEDNHNSCEARTSISFADYNTTGGSWLTIGYIDVVASSTLSVEVKGWHNTGANAGFGHYVLSAKMDSGGTSPTITTPTAIENTNMQFKLIYSGTANRYSLQVNTVASVSFGYIEAKANTYSQRVKFVEA